MRLLKVLSGAFAPMDSELHAVDQYGYILTGSSAISPLADSDLQYQLARILRASLPTIHILASLPITFPRVQPTTPTPLRTMAPVRAHLFTAGLMAPLTERKRTRGVSSCVNAATRPNIPSRYPV